MASGIFLVLDDIAVLLDDTAAMSKVAAKKTAAVLGDDLAVNAEKATGFTASRELPVIWAITKGSFINKMIILPVAFALSTFAPWMIVPILLFGGAYLSFEGTEKVFEWTIGREEHEVVAQVVSAPKEIVEREKEKIQSAVRTDFILSIEIIVIALGTVMDQTLPMRLVVVSFIAILATVGVYGLVALLVRMDDVGFFLIERAKSMKGFMRHSTQVSGNILVASLPKTIRLLGVVGTIAMLLVGGGMFVHNIEAVHHTVCFLPKMVGELVVGLLVGALLLAVVHPIQLARQKK